MELMIVLAILGVLAAIDILALRFGADSRIKRPGVNI